MSPDEAELVDVELEVQAVDEELRPLSQRTTVKRDTGEFTLALPPSAAERPTVVLQVVPTSAQAVVPQKLFTVNPRQGKLELAMGDYGEPVRFKSRVLSRDGQPVAQASVSLAGKVGGGGLFRSQKVLTDANGSFELLTLASESGNPMTLSVVPPPGSSAGLTQRYVQVPRTSLVQSPDVTCGERMKVRGTLLKPSSSEPAAGVQVVAEPLEDVPGWPRPAFRFEAPRTTDEGGHFELAMDPGRYRFDFIPTENLPRVSRIVTVRPAEGFATSEAALELLLLHPLQGPQRHRAGQLQRLESAAGRALRLHQLLPRGGRGGQAVRPAALADAGGPERGLLHHRARALNRSPERIEGPGRRARAPSAARSPGLGQSHHGGVPTLSTGGPP
ncbi:hypothetical protein ACN28I_07965 [Archangium gephyra]|uniref:hypothetical protein n=1 Tax=Archangium gephyra TaxID=48 RepID=UPI003B7A5605